MTEVAFHFNAPDRRSYVCRLLRKATARGSRVVVVAEDPELSMLDETLWTFSALDFVPHCRAHGLRSVLQASPVVLTETLQAELPHSEVVLNLSPGLAQGFERFERLIEVVTADAADRARARERWRHYAQRGYPLTSFDIAANAGDTGMAASS